jgi:redox-sensitive bicupin YhaK (pirin superfamily)
MSIVHQSEACSRKQDSFPMESHPMFQIRPSHERGHADHGWLKTRYTFSFASYRDPAHRQFRALRVMNEDVIAPGQGFGTHPHRDMEIVTYVLSGALAHRDSMGHGEVLRPGEFQRMTAGTGITHSEFNPSATDPVHLYQIWLYPERTGLEPSYEQKTFDRRLRHNRLQLVASPDAADGSLLIHQDAKISLAEIEAGSTLTVEIAENRHAWIQVLRGAATIAGQDFDLQRLQTGDGVAISQEREVNITATADAEIMVFDLA